MRGVIKYIVLATIAFAAIFLMVRIYSKYTQKKEIEVRVQSIQEGCCFESFYGGQVCLDEFDTSIPSLIFYFHPECEHCQYEASEIGLNAAEFINTNIIWITPDDSLERVDEFITSNHLWEVDNLAVLLDHENTFQQFFGNSPFPTVFIYQNDSLQTKFVGETKIEALINSITNN